jgi:hypothetical protein
VAVKYDLASNEFDRAAWAAGRRAFDETLAAGLPVFYRDEQGTDVMLQPDRRAFEIRWIPGAPSGRNYEIVRELNVRAA